MACWKVRHLLRSISPLKCQLIWWFPSHVMTLKPGRSYRQKRHWLQERFCGAGTQRGHRSAKTCRAIEHCHGYIWMNSITIITFTVKSLEWLVRGIIPKWPRCLMSYIYIYGIILQYSKLLNIKCHHDVSSIHREFIAAQWTSLSPLSVSDVAGAVSSAGRSRPVRMCWAVGSAQPAGAGFLVWRRVGFPRKVMYT